MALTPEEQVELETLQAGEDPTETAHEAPDPAFHTRVYNTGVNALQSAGKIAGAARAVTTGPLIGKLMEALSGKKAYTPEEAAAARNFSDLSMAPEEVKDMKTFPTAVEMAKRTGVKNPSLSDILPGYAEPGQGRHKTSSRFGPLMVTTPEKGGMLDPTAWGTVDTLTDPAMYVGAGEMDAGAKALQEAGVLGKLSAAAEKANWVNPGKIIGKTVQGAANVAGRVGPEMTKNFIQKAPGRVLNPLSMVTEGVGRGLYGSTLGPVENEGEKWGKDQVIDRLFQAGVSSPFSIQKKVARGENALMSQRGKIFQDAADRGATLNMAKALDPGHDEVFRLRELGGAENNRLADTIEQELESHMDEVRGTPAVPATPGRPAEYDTGHVIYSPLVDESGKPIEKTVTAQVAPAIPGTPGKPAIPGKTFTPQLGSDLKTNMRKNFVSKGGYQPTAIPGEVEDAFKKTSQGVQHEVEDSVDQVLPGRGKDVAELNDALGALIATKNSQLRVNQSAKDALRKGATLTPIDMILGLGTAAVGGPAVGAGSVLVKKAAQAGQPLLSMPAGYGAMKLGKSTLLDRLNEEMMKKEKDDGKSKRR